MNKIEDWTDGNGDPIELPEDWWDHVDATMGLERDSCSILVRHECDGIIGFSNIERERITEKLSGRIRPVIDY